MAPWLADNSFDISYMDTDCLVTSNNIDSSKGLGGWKLEEFYKSVVFLGPKTYGGVLENGKTFSKVKGLSLGESLDLEVLEKLRIALLLLNSPKCLKV